MGVVACAWLSFRELTLTNNILFVCFFLFVFFILTLLGLRPNVLFINGIPILIRQRLYITKVLLCTFTQIQSTWNIRRSRFYLQFPSNCLAFVCIVQLIIPFTSQTSGKLITGNSEGGTAQKIDQLLRIDILKLLFVYLGIGQWHQGPH